MSPNGLVERHSSDPGAYNSSFWIISPPWPALIHLGNASRKAEPTAGDRRRPQATAGSRATSCQGQDSG